MVLFIISNDTIQQPHKNTLVVSHKNTLENELLESIAYVTNVK